MGVGVDVRGGGRVVARVRVLVANAPGAIYAHRATAAQPSFHCLQDVGYEFQLEGARGDHFEMYADTEEARSAWMNTLTHVIAVADARAEYLRNLGVKVKRKEDFQSHRSLEGGIEKPDAPAASPRKQKAKASKKNASKALTVSAAAAAAAAADDDNHCCCGCSADFLHASARLCVRFVRFVRAPLPHADPICIGGAESPHGRRIAPCTHIFRSRPFVNWQERFMVPYDPQCTGSEFLAVLTSRL